MRSIRPIIHSVSFIHIWKSCIPQKGIEGSNPSFSAKKPLSFDAKEVFLVRTVKRPLDQVVQRTFCFTQHAALRRHSPP